MSWWHRGSTQHSETDVMLTTRTPPGLQEPESPVVGVVNFPRNMLLSREWPPMVPERHRSVPSPSKCALNARHSITQTRVIVNSIVPPVGDSM